MINTLPLTVGYVRSGDLPNFASKVVANNVEIDAVHTDWRITVREYNDFSLS